MIQLKTNIKALVKFAGLGFVSAVTFVYPLYGDFSSSYLAQIIQLLYGLVFVICFGIFVYSMLINEEIETEDKTANNPNRGKPTNLLRYSFTYWFFYYIGALYWLVNPLTIDLSKYWMLIPFAIIAVPAYLATPLMIPAYILSNSFKVFSFNIAIKVLLFVSLNFLIIYIFGHYMPGFPWALPGYIWNGDLQISQALSIWGIYGQTYFSLILGVLWGVGIYWYRKKSRCKYGIAFGVVVCAIISLQCWGNYRLESAERSFTNYRVRCIQGSISQKDKMDRRLFSDNFGLYLNLSYDKDKGPDFIIWPEASLPYLYTEQYPLRKTLSNIIPRGGYLLAGVVRKDPITSKVYNSVVVLDNCGTNVAYYDKRRLVPFGEYVPFRKFIPEVFAPIANSIGDFDVGKKRKFIELKGIKISFMICYEGIFPGEFVFDDTDVIVNVTNDGWFGYSSELLQHLNIVRARAIEEGVPLIRVTNFGVSAVFDSYGRKVDMIDIGKVGVIDCLIPKKSEKTFYRKFFVDNFLFKH